MTKLIVDGKEIDVPPECTLPQACEAAGAEIPIFCYQAWLSIASNCRMCLVEVPAIACWMRPRAPALDYEWLRQFHGFGHEDDPDATYWVELARRNQRESNAAKRRAT